MSDTPQVPSTDIFGWLSLSITWLKDSWQNGAIVLCGIWTLYGFIKTKIVNHIRSQIEQDNHFDRLDETNLKLEGCVKDLTEMQKQSAGRLDNLEETVKDLTAHVKRADETIDKLDKKFDKVCKFLDSNGVEGGKRKYDPHTRIWD